MTHKNEHHINIVLTGDDYDLVKAYRTAFGLDVGHQAWRDAVKRILITHLQSDLHDLRVKFGGTKE